VPLLWRKFLVRLRLGNWKISKAARGNLFSREDAAVAYPISVMGMEVAGEYL